MKKIIPLICLLLLIISCKNDDDVTIARCTEPESIEISEISFNNALISWESTNETASYTIEYGLSGFLPGTGTQVQSETNSINLTDLTANTTYNVYIKSICSSSNESMFTEAVAFTTVAPPVIAEFLTNLSELNLFTGDLSELNPSVYAFEYKLATPLFSDYAHKQRLIALPNGTSMSYIDNGLPNFPDNTLIAKTFFYNIDDRDESLGKTIIETRILIKINGEWQSGNYIWNEEQTDAVLDSEGADVAIDYIDEDGEINIVNYKIPSNTDCFTCHGNAGNLTPIGPKLRTLNFNNQLQDFIDNSYIDGLGDASNVTSLPSWDDDSFTQEERVRAYFDINCAHCHSPGGFCETESDLRLRYETSFDDSNIYEDRYLILGRMSNYIPGWSMPFIGTSMVHEEGFDLIEEYILSL